MGVAGSIGGVLQRRRRAAARAAFDPGGANVEAVKSYVTDHPDRASAVLAAEQGGKKRSTLIAWLQVAEQQHWVNSYDPAAYTVEEALQFVADYPDHVDRVRQLEFDGDARVTLLSQLDKIIEDRAAAAPSDPVQ